MVPDCKLIPLAVAMIDPLLSPTVMFKVAEAPKVTACETVTSAVPISRIPVPEDVIAPVTEVADLVNFNVAELLMVVVVALRSPANVAVFPLP